jgi:hypothetical protein
MRGSKCTLNLGKKFYGDVVLVHGAKKEYEAVHLDRRVAAIFLQKSRYMHGRVLCLAYIVMCLRIIDDTLGLCLSGRAMHSLADHTNLILSSFDL